MACAVVCPDKFRGTLAAVEVAAAMARGLRVAGFDEVREVPLADGGEGTLDVLLVARGGSKRYARVTGPLGDPVDAAWGLLPDGTAVIEMAQASGLALVEGRNDPLRATSKGTGELIATAFRSGARSVLVTVGGSASTDGGLGAIEALGWTIAGRRVTVACDVRTLFLDAASVYGPQKGASPAEIALLSRRLQALVQQYSLRTRVDVSNIVGSGAGGGIAGGMAALGAQVLPGFEVVAEAVGLGVAMEGADLMVTGEGRFDATSYEGKVVGEALSWAAEEGIPRSTVIAGQVARDEVALAVDDRVLTLALVDRAWQVDEAKSRAAVLIEEAAIEAGRWALAGGGRSTDNA